MNRRNVRIPASQRRRFRRYPQYKESRVEWLGEIPAHWEVKRLKFVTHIVAGQSPPSVAVTDGMDGLPFLQGNAEFGPLHPTPHQVCDTAPKRANPGDVLISVRAPVGAINIADQLYGIGRGLCAVRPGAQMDRSFCFYDVMAMRPLLNAVTTGSTYDAVTASNVGDLPMLLPQQDEQRAIAAFLDRETARTDELEAKKQRLIELLDEKRAALINRTVIRGLDPNASMKNSGIEWLGEIPSHWEVKRLKFVTNIFAGQSPPSVAVTDGMDGLPFLQGNAEFGPLHPTPRQVCDTAPKRAKPGDVLISVRAPVGAINIADQPYGIGRGLCAVRPAARIDRSFCFYDVMAMRPLLNAVTTGSTYDAVTASNVGDLPMLLPQRDEQRAIAAFLDRETSKVDLLIAKVGHAINRLNEFRTALISAAVTGKIDVRKEPA